jgi:hypothetical protein
MVPLILATPSWLPLAMVGVLLLLLGFLFWSMRRNINRIEVQDEPETGGPVTPVSPME